MASNRRASDRPKGRMVLAIAVLLGSVFLSATCHGESSQGEQSNSIKQLRKSAEDGDVRAQAKLGLLYFDGKEVNRNPSEAAKWLLKAAQQGNSGAQCLLAA